MGSEFNNKIDAYCHFAFRPVMDRLEEITQQPNFQFKLFAANKGLMDPVERIQIMDETGVERSIIEPLPEIGTFPMIAESLEYSSEIARLANDQVAALVAAHPNRFSGVAALPTISAEAAASELEYAVKNLGLLGGFIGAGPFSMPMDADELDILWSKAVELDVPIWIHPCRPAQTPDYRIEDEGSKYQYFQAYAWVADDTLAMHRIVFSGVFERFPQVKIIIHHHGAMIPYFAHRVDTGIEFFEQNMGFKYPTPIAAPYADHYKKFYIDTATQGFAPGALKVAIDFFDADKVLFGSDCPMDKGHGRVMINGAYDSIRALDLGPDVEYEIYRGNAARILNI